MPVLTEVPDGHNVTNVHIQLMDNCLMSDSDLEKGCEHYLLESLSDKKSIQNWEGELWLRIHPAEHGYTMEVGKDFDGPPPSRFQRTHFCEIVCGRSILAGSAECTVASSSISSAK